MASPTRRNGTANLQFRRVIPADIERQRERLLAMGVKLPKAGFFWSLRTADPREAKARQAERLSEFEAWCSNLRRLLADGPRVLTQKEVFALSRELASRLIADHEENPGNPSDWLKQDGSAQQKLFREERSIAALFNAVDRLLAEHGLVVTRESRMAVAEQFVGKVDDTGKVIDAGDRGLTLETLRRMSVGDYLPNPELAKRPIIDWTAKATATSAGLGFGELLQVWIDWRKGRAIPRPGTVQQFKSRLNEFAAFIKHDDASRVTPDDVIRYRDNLLKMTKKGSGKPLSPKTVKERIVTLTVIFGAAVSARKLASNPADGLTPAGKTRPQRGFTESEARLILRASRRETGFRRWGPWLMQASGMRVEEAAQLRRCDIIKESGVWLFVVSPEAGKVKNDKARHVPLHSSLLKEGFLDFANGVKTEWLFPEACLSRRGERKRKTGETHDRGSEILGKFVRGLGIEGVQPNHGWRHLFMRRWRRGGGSVEARDKIMGHSSGKISDEYDPGPDAVFLKRELEKLEPLAVGGGTSPLPQRDAGNVPLGDS